MPSPATSTPPRRSLPGCNASADQVFCDNDWRIEAIGRSAARRLQLAHRPFHDLQGRRLWELIPQFVGTPAESLLRAAMLERRPVHFEWRLPPPGAALAITAEAAAGSLALRISEILAPASPSAFSINANSSSHTASDASPDLALNAHPAYACTGLGRFITANARAVELLGCVSTTVLSGRKFTQLHLPRDVAALLQHRLELTLLSGESETVEVMHADPNGRMVRYRHRFTPVLDSLGIVRHVLGVAQIFSASSPQNSLEPVELAPLTPAPTPPPLLAPAAAPSQPAARSGDDPDAALFAQYQTLSEVAALLLKENLRKAPLFTALQRLARAIGAEIYLLHTASADGQQLRFEASGGVNYADLASAANPAVGEGLCGAAARDDWPVIIEDIANSEHPDAADFRTWGARALVCHPLAIGRRLLGTLLFATTSRDRWIPSELQFIRDAAEVVAASLETRRVLDDTTHARISAEQAAQRKDEFLATLSHELRTPLHPALLVATHALGNADLPQSARDDFETIAKNIQVEVRLIDDLLDVTRAGMGKLSVDLRPLSLHPVLDDALSTVKADITEKNLQLTVDLAPVCPRVRGDVVRLQQVFWNILKNAVKFTPPGGALTVRTSITPAGEACIEFTDTGAGLTADEIALAFDSFTQGEHAHGGASPLGGLGLGLAIARHLVNLHSGRIRVASEGRGRGASFVVDLPLLSEDAPVETRPAALPPPPQPPGSSSPSPLRILLVEDHHPTREALLRLLVHRRHEVIAAGSVGEARAIAQRKRFELVISDIGLPDGTGYELMASLHNDFGVRGIALTGFGTEQHIEQAHAAGFIAHLIKPISIQALEAALAGISAGLLASPSDPRPSSTALGPTVEPGVPSA